MGYGLTQTLLITAGYEGRDFGAGLLCGIAGVILLELGYWLVDPAGFREAWRDD